MTTVISSNFNNIARAISAYADAARADASLLLSTALVGSDSRITDAGENYTGTIRWLTYTDGGLTAKPSSVDTDGSGEAISEFMGAGNLEAVYIKNVDVVAAKENSVQSLISKVDGLSYLGSKFGAVRARREDANLRNILEGVGLDILGSNVTKLTAAGTTAAGRLATSGAGLFGYVTEQTATTSTDASWAPLFANETSASIRSSFFDGLLDAMTAVSGEFEDSFYYLVVSPTIFNILRKQNVLDVNPVQDGNLNVNTLLGGKIRLIITGNSIGSTGISGLNVSFLVKASAVHYSNVSVNNPTAIDTNPTFNRGFGEVTIVSRWGNIIHPMGYTFAGTATAFPTNTVLSTAASWTVVATNVNQTGIFPIFHG